ncbi:Gfo/Idh/MocA family protein [Goodfellowiella coeruleoviolacea]|uniref:Dehydrogenase n=1 Tax=Goodfellowiella coeruleoviolacea TaxID=334858 RepID=A0AAE3GGH3_9PSEU|nr:Gfo/Idh/MocA family oxidoreductase [Goodfellowiella coeruleoviolacea]MCP2167238.1 putative dehydrogenase [Goodfellowiella coeruleoviolacea]
MGNKIRAAIVGTGAIAEVGHLPALRAEADRVDVVAAVDVDQQRVTDFADRADIPGRYTSLSALLDREQPDLVHICTPPALHAEQASACLAAGAWVLLEKPPCLSLAEFDRIQAAERAGGPYASVVFQHRFGSGARHFADLLAAGELGRPLVAQCVTAWYRDHAYFDVPWRGRWETEGGGPTMGHGIHQMDLMLALLGEWTEVRAMAGRLDRDVRTEDVSTALVRFANGAMASVVNSLLSPRQESYLRFDLTDATVELTHLYGHSNDSWRYTPAPHVTDTDRIAAWRTPAANVSSSHTAQLPHLLDAMARGVRPPVSGVQARMTLELVTAIYRSAFTGEPVHRDQLGPDDPFYHRLHGDTPGWAGD